MAKKRSTKRSVKVEAMAEIPEGSIKPDALGKVVFYRDSMGTVRAAIVSSVADDGRTVGLHVFDPGQRPDRNLLRAKEGVGRGQFSFDHKSAVKASEADDGREPGAPDSDRDHTS